MEGVTKSDLGGGLLPGASIFAVARTMTHRGHSLCDALDYLSTVHRGRFCAFEIDDARSLVAIRDRLREEARKRAEEAAKVAVAIKYRKRTEPVNFIPTTERQRRNLKLRGIL